MTTPYEANLITIRNRIAEIEARLSCISQGEWKYTGVSTLPRVRLYKGFFGGYLLADCKNSHLTKDKTVGNAKFIAHSRNDVPWLMSELKDALDNCDKMDLKINTLNHELKCYREDAVRYKK